MAVIPCNNPECEAAEKHVPSCPLSEEMELLKERFKATAGAGEVIILPNPDDERFILSFDLDKLPTPQALDIISRLLPEWIGGFLEANHKYREVKNDLGYKGVLPDVNRKYGVLKARVWDGDEETGREPTRGIILDLIGHLFLMLHMYDEESGRLAVLRAEAMERHPAGKGRLPVEPEPVETHVERKLCTATKDVPGWVAGGPADGESETVKCFREPGHRVINHMGRTKSGHVVEWHVQTGALL